MKKLAILVNITLMLLSSLVDGPAQQGEITVPLRFDFYYTYDQVVEALKALNKAYPDLTTLDLVGKSEENRNIYALTVNNPETGDALSKPGVYVDGNIHGNEIQAGEVCLYFLNQLLTKYGKNEKITRLVDKNAYYVIPVVNVDGRYHFFTDANTSSSNRGLRRPKDDDRDGLFDEDFTDDLDGDGNICQMRKKDPFGRYKTDPEDPRLMVRIEPGDKGEWTILGQEGIDNDGDGRVNEDSEGYVDGNRNWGYNWAPPYVQRGAGYYPLSGTGIKAIAKYLLDHPNIIMVYAFHNSGGMYLRGPSTKDQGELLSSDIQVYDYLGENNEKIVPGYRYLISWKDLYPTYGDFTDFTDNVLGSYSFVGELYQSSAETYRKPDEPESEETEGDRFRENRARSRERLEFNDYVVQGELYKPWKPFKHPTYGDIEIGGWVKMSSRLPHPFMLQDLVHRNASAVMFSSEQTPEITMEIFEKTKVGKDLYRVRVRLHNSKAIPSMTYRSVQKKLYPQDIVKVSGNGIKVVSGGKLTDAYRNQVTYKEHKPEIQFCQVPGFGKIEFQFLISGKGKVTIDYSSTKAGSLNKSIDL
ncbi:MAG: hypothetical protein JSV24_02430 [Bacteroidales bacterium]|nr:MAG: hypothetical protein JSV24_02430 [Bacteroidales bacterium]